MYCKYNTEGQKSWENNKNLFDRMDMTQARIACAGNFRFRLIDGSERVSTKESTKEMVESFMCGRYVT